MKHAKQGTALLSSPFLNDPNFSRCVVLICEKDENGTLGFVLNKKTNQLLNEVIDLETSTKYPIYYGGPVYTDNLYFLHKRPDIISEGTNIIDEVYWGGNFEEVLANINAGILSSEEIKFYLGYSGWSKGQLEDEIEEGSWILSNTKTNNVFNIKYDLLWKNMMNELGGEYKMMVNFPLDPKMN